ncbi:Uncharacterized protein HZ326_14862 [Fusarium oxysporum f. sp. albedinis]|nr:Uncharacterized protein HZ326_14862 [Fusarium oxysporum f. sp. albedinis]
MASQRKECSGGMGCGLGLDQREKVQCHQTKGTLVQLKVGPPGQSLIPPPLTRARLSGSCLRVGLTAMYVTCPQAPTTKLSSIFPPLPNSNLPLPPPPPPPSFILPVLSCSAEPSLCVL